MIRFRNALAVLLFVLVSAGQALASTLVLKSADGVSVYADYYGDNDKSKPIILLFHQASSNAGEYSTIARHLNELGFAALAVDQRSGGRAWGRQNRTVEAFPGNASFLDALIDLEAALDWAKADGRKRIVVWGSSYSASLVFLLAAKHPGIAGVLSFSPGEYFGRRDIVRSAAAKVQAPTFISSASETREIAEAGRIFDASPAALKVHYRPSHGTHGSSTLRTDSNPQGARDNWNAVEAFLARLR